MSRVRGPGAAPASAELDAAERMSVGELRTSRDNLERAPGLPIPPGSPSGWCWPHP